MSDIWHTGWNSAADARIKNEQFGGEAMTDRLKEWLDECAEDQDIYTLNDALAALRAVVELHGEWVPLPTDVPQTHRCYECAHEWPCPTIREVEKALGLN